MREVKVVPALPYFKPLLPKRVVAYCRVSTQQEIQYNSLSAQKEYFEDYIKTRTNWRFAGIYSDQASGRNNKKMKSFQNMLNDCRAGLIDIILVKSISRLGRNTVQFLNAIEEFNALDIDVYFQVENLHGKDPVARKALTIYASIYQNESETKSFNIKWGHKVRFENGSSLMYNRPCYGYMKNKNGSLEIAPRQADIVKRIFEYKKSGFSLRKIAAALMKDNIPAPRGGNKWGIETIRKILNNEKYYGTVILGKTYISDYFNGKQSTNNGESPKYIMENHHEAIIEQANSRNHNYK